MSVLSFPLARARSARIAVLRAELEPERGQQEAVLAFGVAGLDERLASGGLDGAGLHEVAAASPRLTDEATATLFVAGIAARFASQPSLIVLWALSGFDLYAPGLQQAGLGPDRILYAQGRSDAEVLALAEDGLRSGSLACVVAEVKVADHKATRRLQLAASDGKTPILLHRRHRSILRFAPFPGMALAS